MTGTISMYIYYLHPHPPLLTLSLWILILYKFSQDISILRQSRKEFCEHSLNNSKHSVHNRQMHQAQLYLIQYMHHHILELSVLISRELQTQH